MGTRKLVKAGVGVVLGNVVAERFILRASDDDPSGFVTVANGIGMDEIARAATILASMMLIDRFF